MNCQMPMKNIKSTDLDALDAAFAEKVAGWTDVCYEEGEDVDIESRCYYPWSGMAGTPPDGGKRRLISSVTRSADTVLPWLDNAIYWDSNFCDGQHQVFVNEMRRDVVNKGDYEGTAKTFPHAAAIALLRAHGVKVE